MLYKHVGVTPDMVSGTFHYSNDSMCFFITGNTDLSMEINNILFGDSLNREATQAGDGIHPFSDFGNQYMLQLQTYKRIMIIERLRAYKHVVELMRL